MKTWIAVLFILLGGLTVGAQTTAPDMAIPKVEHKTKSYSYQATTTTVTCPDGYEGHFVDIRPGFDSSIYLTDGATVVGIEPGFAICFKKEFMDQVRKNPDLIQSRPKPPRGA